MTASDDKAMELAEIIEESLFRACSEIPVNDKDRASLRSQYADLIRPHLTPEAMNIYIHTINGHPAAFDGDQICHAWPRCPVALSLDQIRREQTRSMEYRVDKGYPIDVGYGYRLYCVRANP